MTHYIPVKKPDRVDFFQNDDSIEFIVSWMKWSVVWYFFFSAILWFFTVALLGESLNSGFFPISIGAVFFLLLALFISYVTLGIAFNETSITVTHDHYTQTIAPFKPFGKDYIDEYASDRMTQIYVSKFSTAIRGGSGETKDTFSIYALLKAGGREKLFSIPDDGDVALFIAQEIRLYLSLDDSPVSDEYQ